MNYVRIRLFTIGGMVLLSAALLAYSARTVLQTVREDRHITRRS